MNKLTQEWNKTKNLFTKKKLMGIVVGTAIISFGLYNIHQRANITEGGALGMILLLQHWTGLSPSILSPVIDFICYGVAFKYLGWDFLKVSFVSSMVLAAFFKLWEMFPPLLPEFLLHPFIAAILGGLFIGIGVGFVVRQGGSSGGDDGLALAISKATGVRLSYAYLITDLTVLLLSLTYTPLVKIAYSLITVTISSWLVDFVQGMGKKKDVEEENNCNET